MSSLDYTEDIKIILASQNDVDEIHNIWMEAADWLKSRKINQWRDDQLTKEAVLYCYENSHMFVVKANNFRIGTFFILWTDPFIWGKLDNNSSGYLHRFVVRRKYAGNRLGNKILNLAENFILEKGKTYFRLDCMAENPKLNDFYLKAGFNYRGRVEGEDWSASLFEKELKEAY